MNERCLTRHQRDSNTHLQLQESMKGREGEEELRMLDPKAGQPKGTSPQIVTHPSTPTPTEEERALFIGCQVRLSQSPAKWTMNF